MPYTYTSFGTVDLPIYNIDQDHATGESPTALIVTPNGAYDYLGTARNLPKTQIIPVKGDYSDELDYLVDELGNYIVDENGDLIVVGDTGDTLRNHLDNLKSKLGRADQLWRTDLDTAGLRRWKTARLRKVEHAMGNGTRGVLAKITAIFETADPAWRSETLTTTTQSLATGLHTFTVDVLGSEEILDSIITITATSTITSVGIVLASADVDFTWTGTLAIGNSLVINNGKLTIKNNGADAYNGFTLNSGHMAAGWLKLLAESNEISVTLAGAGSFSVTHYDQWT
jgi:hypothetical protein